MGGGRRRARKGLRSCMSRAMNSMRGSAWSSLSAASSSASATRFSSSPFFSTSASATSCGSELASSELSQPRMFAASASVESAR